MAYSAAIIHQSPDDREQLIARNIYALFAGPGA